MFHFQDSKAVIGMLKPNTVYEIRIAGETKSLFSDRYYTGDFSERRTVNLSSKCFYLEKWVLL